MSHEMESPGITFEVQWKKKSGAVSRKEDVTSIGLWDPEDSTLDWKTFKSYVCQNLGTVEDITVAYVDSEGDELPIESECEFQEALKFARQRARKGRETVLKVDRQGSAPLSPLATKSAENMLGKPVILRCDKQKHGKSSGKLLHKTSGATAMRAGPDERKMKAKKRGSCGDHQITEKEKLRVEKMELVSKLMEELHMPSPETEDSPPQWFKKYMHKLKAEVVTEVTARVLHGMQQMLDRRAGCCSSSERPGMSWPATKSKKKKRVSDEDSSDGALGSDTRDHKLLKKIEKLHKREKKLEKKLDSKLEKLENKTKRMMEKKSQSKVRCERAPEKKLCFVSKKRSGDVLVGTYLMDAILLNDGPKTEIHIRPGEHFSKIWEIMNTGTLPWTDKTELRQAWGTLGLEPEETVLKCPILEPGEKGQIAVNFRAPEFAGTFESYWHFYHMGDRFGHWIGCAVVVDSREERPEKLRDLPDKEAVDESKSRTRHPVDLTMKSKPEQISNPCTEFVANITLSKSRTEHPVDLTMKSKPEQISNPCTECVANITLSKTERENNIREPKDAEYESDSDSDNLSIISGTVSVSSDSEDDENFVVVPMPACFLYDVPLGTVETVPVVIKENVENKPKNGQRTVTVTKENDMKIEIANDRREDVPSVVNENVENRLRLGPRGVMVQRALHLSKSNDLVIKIKRGEDKYSGGQKVMNIEPEVEILCDPVPMQAENLACSLASEERPQERVFAVDMEGHCKVEPVRQQGEHNVTSWEKRIFAVDMAGNCMPVESSYNPVYSFGCSSPERGRSSAASSPARGSSSSTQSHTENSTSTGTSSQARAESNTYTGASSQSALPAHDPLGNVIHILPETLVTGAVNAASSAFSTARAVISNLQSRQPWELKDWNWTPSKGSNWTMTDRSTTESLKLLIEMGFTNKILNVLLLQRYDNDVTKVVAELLTYKEHGGTGYRRPV